MRELSAVRLTEGETGAGLTTLPPLRGTLPDKGGRDYPSVICCANAHLP